MHEGNPSRPARVARCVCSQGMRACYQGACRQGHYDPARRVEQAAHLMPARRADKQLQFINSATPALLTTRMTPLQ
jgi:hypothetical protein